MRTAALIFSLLTISIISKAQTFNQIESSIPALTDGQFAFGDIDNDNDFDLLVTGKNASNQPTTLLLQNNGSEYHEINTNLPGVFNSTVDFIDFNNDNLLDFIITGNTGSALISKLYRNLGELAFEEVSVPLQGVARGAVAWSDFDNDGDHDLFITGATSSNSTDYVDYGQIMSVYRNDGGYSFELVDQDIAGVQRSSLDFNDFDKDGDQDLLLSGQTSNSDPGAEDDGEFTAIYINTNGAFHLSNINLHGIKNGAARWADFNNDGISDIIVAGDDFTVPQFRIYIGDGTGFSQLLYHYDHFSWSLDLGDFDNDGDIDIASNASGGDDNDNWVMVYQNNGETFEPYYSHQSLRGPLVAHDIDVDGDLDIAVMGLSDTSLPDAIIYSNETTTVNENPTSPIGLVTTKANDNDVHLMWSQSSDDKTNAGSLSYNVSVSTVENYGDIVNPMSNPDDGTRKVLNFGNAQNDTTYLLRNLPIGKFVWRVQAIDNTYNSSNFSDADTIFIMPSSDFLLPVQACVGEIIAVSYAGNAPEDADFDWDFGGAEIISGTGVGPYELRFTHADTVEISLSLKKNGVTSDTTVQVLNILNKPVSSFSISTPRLCDTDTVVVSYTGDPFPNAVYQWNFSGANVLSEENNTDYELNWTSPGVKNLSLQVESNGCFSANTYHEINVYQPDATFSLDNHVCVGEDATVTFAGDVSDSAVFIWDFGSANIISGDGAGPFLVNWDSVGEDVVSLTVDDNGCVANNSLSVMSHSVPTASFTLPEKMCFNDVAFVQYTGTASDSATYNWDFDGGEVTSGSNQGPIQLTWNEPGVKNISLQVIEHGCSNDTTIALTVNELIDPIQICVVNIDDENHNTIVWRQPNNAAYDSVIVYKESTQADVYVRIGAKPADGATAFSDLGSNALQNATRYKISAVDTCGFETELSTYHKAIHLTINSGLNGAWNLIWDGYEGADYNTINIYRGGSLNELTKIAEQSSNIDSYTDLTPPDGSLFYQVEAVMTTSCVEGVARVAVSNKMKTDIVTSIESNANSGLRIHPNPADDVIHLPLNELSNEAVVEVLSTNGKAVTNQVQSNPTQISVAHLQAGLYLLRISDGKKTAYAKFIKR